MTTLYITHPSCHLHEMGEWHPESPDRLAAINDHLLSHGIFDLLTEKQAGPAARADLLRVHTAEHLDYLHDHAPAQGYFEIDPDTVMNRHTLDAAYAAAGSGITAVDAIMQNQADTAFCSVRPPGHHARPNQAMGFCFFNNIAIATAYALEKYKLNKVAIIDFDVHHGNGTEEVFADDPRVLMCSFYQYPLFPNVYAINSTKNMLNIAVDAYTDGTQIRQLITDAWLPQLAAFKPEFIFISAGFDAHREDGLGQLALTEADYAWITEQVAAIADATARGRIVSFLEGGYNLSALGRSAVAHIKTLAKL